MARYRNAVWRPVERYQPGAPASIATRMTTPRRLILHTAVSDQTSLFSYFNVRGRATSHFYVAHDGTVEQYIDTDYHSTANLDGNRDSITVESQDRGGPFPAWDANGGDVPAWTVEQVEALAALAVWAHEVHGLSLRALASARPGTRGIGYHRQGIDPWRIDGGESWSEATGKVCPGDRRIAQIPHIITRAKILAGIRRPDAGGQSAPELDPAVPTRPRDDRWKPGTRLAAFTAMGVRFTQWLTRDEIARQGSAYQPGPAYSTYDDFNVRKVQALMGNTPDPAGKAYLGPRQWHRLFTEARPARSKLPLELAGHTPPQARKAKRAASSSAPSLRPVPGPTPTPSPRPAPVPRVPPKDAFVPGERHEAFTAMGERFLVWLTPAEIHRAGSVYTPGPRYSVHDARNVRAVQVLMGNAPDAEVDAYFGAKQWERLFREARPPGATVPSALRRGHKRNVDPPGDRLVPVAGQRITVKFGKPGSWSAGEHTGVDITSNGDDTIRCVGAGTVVVAGMVADWGNRVIVKHPNGRYSWYCHLDAVAVQKGQRVSRGTVLGTMGETGRTFGKHLHYQESTGGYGYYTYKRPIMLGFSGY